MRALCAALAALFAYTAVTAGHVQIHTAPAVTTTITEQP